jgi:hypothetical protein
MSEVSIENWCSKSQPIWIYNGSPLVQRVLKKTPLNSSPPGINHLAQGMPHRILISTADFKKRYDFLFICSVMTKNFLLTRRVRLKELPWR